MDRWIELGHCKELDFLRLERVQDVVKARGVRNGTPRAGSSSRQDVMAT